MIDAEEVNLIESCCQTEVGSILGAFFAFLGCVFYPLKKWWEGLAPATRGVILVGLSTIIGTLDTCFDWIVLIDWYGQGLWRIASCLCATIIISGCVFILFALFDAAKHTVYATSEKISDHLLCLFIPFFLGFGNIILSLMVVSQSEIEPEVYFQFHLGRTFEIFIEAAPGGGLQLYDLIVTDSLTQYWKLSFISIIFSILSIAFGTEEAIGKALPLYDRVLLYIFSATDFIFRVSSVSFFLKQDDFKVMEFFLLPAILLYEMIPWLINIILSPNMKLTILSILASFAGAVSSICVAGVHLVFPEFEHIRKNFRTYFMIRFCISSILVAFTMTKDTSATFLGIVFCTGAISFCISWRIHVLIFEYGERLRIDKKLLLGKVNTKAWFFKGVNDGNLDVVDTAIRSGFDVNEFDQSNDARTDDHGKTEMEKTALMISATSGDHHMISKLIELGAKLDLQNQIGFTALMFASQYGNESSVVILIESGASLDIQNRSGKTALMISANRGFESSINSLIESSANIDLQDKSGSTALISAAKEGMLSSVVKLIEFEANLDLQDVYGYTALMWAAQQGFLSAVVMLIESKANVGLENTKRQTALGCLPQFHRSIGSLMSNAGSLIAQFLGSHHLLVECLWRQKFMGITDMNIDVSERDFHGSLQRQHTAMSGRDLENFFIQI